MLPMGWVKTPPYFCIIAETIADQTNSQHNDTQPLPPHPQESSAAVHDDTYFRTKVPRLVPEDQVLKQPLDYTDVYMDDFMMLAQSKAIATQLCRHLMYNVNEVFRLETDAEDSCLPPHKEPISQKRIDN
jgi:hypothetical protein